MTELLLENAHLRMRITPQGGAVQSLERVADGQPLLRAGKGARPDDVALFPMLPVANRVRDNRFNLAGERITLPDSPVDNDFFLHGDGWVSRWTVVSQAAQRCVLTLSQRHRCGFDYHAELSYTLVDARLRVAITLRHRGAKPMLYGMGIHPFFTLDSDTTLTFSSAGYWPEGKRHLPERWQPVLPEDADFNRPAPVADRWQNVGYSGWGGVATLRRSDMTVQLTARTPWLMLYHPPGEAFVCLEPQTHPVDAHSMDGQPGLVLLNAGEEMHFTAEIALV